MYVAAVNPCFVGNGFPAEYADCLRAVSSGRAPVEIQRQVLLELCKEVWRNTKSIAGIWPQDHDGNWNAGQQFRDQCLPKDYWSYREP
jgi:hypothetical protein